MVFPTKVSIIGKRGHLQKLMCVTSLSNPKCFNCGLTYFFLIIFESSGFFDCNTGSAELNPSHVPYPHVPPSYQGTFASQLKPRTGCGV